MWMDQEIGSYGNLPVWTVVSQSQGLLVLPCQAGGPHELHSTVSTISKRHFKSTCGPHVAHTWHYLYHLSLSLRSS